MTTKKGETQTAEERRRFLTYAARTASSIFGLAASSAWAEKPFGGKPNAAPAQSQSSTPEKRRIVIATTSATALPYLPLLVAQHKGFFAQFGLELEISEQQSSARAIGAVSSGGADLVCGWLENVLGAAGRAINLQSVVLLGNAPMMSLGVSTRDSTVAMLKNLSQLRGRKIGVVALNSPTHTVALATIRRAGLRASDVGFVSVGSAASAQAALRSGQIDALMHIDPLMRELEQSGEIRLLADLRSPSAAFDALGVHLPSGCVAATQEFLQRYPIAAQACSDALVLALQWLQRASLRDMLAFHEALPETVQAMPAQSFVSSYEKLRLAYSSDGVCSAKSAQDLLQAIYEADPALRLEKIDASRSINSVLVQRSAARLKA